ncbi:oligosaccharide flippase family protein [Streptococcus suis]|nr:oligosaccharide flippase family protein [Streptococcus suis]NQO84842.1 oligosaccharide flippase family protein [Streptococcus suis]HEM5490809.1 oligosaccharide flippase family protein [Streptococcus suis]
MSVKKLVKSSMIYTIGALLLQGLSFITMPIYTRIISQEVYGQFSLYNSWLSILGLFIGIQTVGSLPIAKVKYADEYDRYAAHALSLSTIVFVVLFSLAIIFRKYISIYLGFSELVSMLLVVQSFIGYIGGFLGQYFIQLQRAKEKLLLSAVNAFITILLSLYLIQVMNDDFLARIIGALLPATVMAGIALFYIYSHGRVFVQREYILYTLSISIPLIFHHLGHQILGQLDRLMIGKMLTLKDVALYSFGYNLGMIIQLVLVNINSAWVPWYFEVKRSGNPNVSRYVFNFLALSLFLTLGYLTVFPELALLMGGTRYATSLNFIALIILSYYLGFLYTFPLNTQFYHGNTKFVPVGTLLAGILNWLINLYFIPNFGIQGAAIATIISYIALFLFHFVIARILYKNDEISLLTVFILLGIASGYAYLMNLFVSNIYVRWSLGLVVLVVYVYTFRKELELAFSKFKAK